MKVTKDSCEGRDEEENKLETKITKNANHGVCKVWEVPIMCSSGRKVREYISLSQESMRTK